MSRMKIGFGNFELIELLNISRVQECLWWLAPIAQIFTGFLINQKWPYFRMRFFFFLRFRLYYYA